MEVLVPQFAKVLLADFRLAQLSERRLRRLFMKAEQGHHLTILFLIDGTIACDCAYSSMKMHITITRGVEQFEHEIGVSALPVSCCGLTVDKTLPHEMPLFFGHLRREESAFRLKSKKQQTHALVTIDIVRHETLPDDFHCRYCALVIGRLIAALAFHDLI